MASIGNILLGAGLLLLGGILTATGGGAIGLRLILTGALTLATGLVTPSGQSGFDSSPRYGFDNLTNQAHDGAPMRVVYGKERVAPSIISQVIEGVGDERVLKMLMAVCEGEIDSITDIRINDTSLDNFKGIVAETRLGTASQEIIFGFNEAGTPYQAATRLEFNQVHTHETRVECDAVILAFAWQRGLFSTQKDGDIVPAGWTGKFEYRAYGSDGIWNPVKATTFITNGPFVVGVAEKGQAVEGAGWTTKGKTAGNWECARQTARSTYRSRFRIDFPSRGRWEVRVTGADDAEQRSSLDVNVPTLTTVVEVQNDQRTYPNTALLALTIPPSAQLSGSTPHVTCLVKGRKVYDPRSGTTAWSRNPVLCLRDLLLSQRYGCGDDFTSSDIDDGAGSTWRDAADYCDELLTGDGLAPPHARHELDLVLDVRAPASHWVSQIVESARLTLTDWDGLIRLRPAEARASVRDFSEDEGDGRRKNIVAGVVENGTAEPLQVSTLVDSVLPHEHLYDEVRVQYVDRARDYVKQTVIVADLPVPIGSITSGPIAVGERVSNATGTWHATVTRPAANGDGFLYVAQDDDHAGPLTANQALATTGGAQTTHAGTSHPQAASPERPLEIQLFGVTRKEQAMREGRFQHSLARFARRMVTFDFFVGDKDLVPGDTISIYAARLGWAPKLFTIRSVRYGMNGIGRIEAREYVSDVFASIGDRTEDIVFRDPGDSIVPNLRKPAGGNDSAAAEDEKPGAKPGAQTKGTPQPIPVQGGKGGSAFGALDLYPSAGEVKVDPVDAVGGFF